MSALWLYLYILVIPTALECRKMFHESHNNEKQCNLLTEKTAAVTDKSTALLMGYKGAARMMLSRFNKGGIEKLKTFNEGKMWLEKAITKDVNQLELRYIRFSFQTTVPSLLKYSSSIAVDKKLIMEKTPTCKDTDLKKKIKDFLLASKYLSMEEKRNIKEKWNK